MVPSHHPRPPLADVGNYQENRKRGEWRADSDQKEVALGEGACKTEVEAGVGSRQSLGGGGGMGGCNEGAGEGRGGGTLQ